MVGLGIDDTYTIERMRTLILHPEYEGEHYAWRMGDEVISTERDLIFCQAEAGTYNLQYYHCRHRRRSRVFTIYLACIGI